MDDIMIFYAYIASGVGGFFLVFSLLNIIWLALYTKKPSVFDAGHVTVCVPARNEEKNIENCVRSLMNQSYKDYDVVVLDDNSTDSTPVILDELYKEFPGKLRVMNGRPLPSGWTGKIFAMHQLVQEAKGNYLLFTDADTVHDMDSIAFAVTNMERHKSDMLSGYIKQRMLTFGEQTTVPLMYMLTGFVLPLFLNRISSFPAASVAIGQYIMIRRDVFEAVGGYKSMRGMISEDVFLARLVKSHGYKTIFVDCKKAASCRMYASYQEGVHGIMKNIFSFMSNKTFLLLASVLAVVLFLLLPFPLFFISVFHDYVEGFGQTLFSSLLGLNVGMMFLTWVFVSLSQKLPFATPFLYPLLFGNLVYMAMLSYNHSVSGEGFVWKGRVVH